MIQINVIGSCEKYFLLVDFLRIIIPYIKFCKDVVILVAQTSLDNFMS